MGLLARAVEQRSTLANPQQWLVNYFSGPMTAAGKRVSALESLQYSAVYACIRILSETVASLPLPVYRRLPNGGKERAEDHPYYELLHDRPNPEMTSLEFFELVMGHLLLWGNHYSELERNGAGRVIGVWPLRPDRMSIFRLSDYSLLYRYTHQWGEIQTFTADQLLHVKGKSHDGMLGLSVLGLIREQVGLGLALQEHAARFFGNNSNPGGLLTHPGKLSKEGGEHLRKQWEESHRGLENAHRVAVLEEGVTWQSIGIPPQDAQLLEERRFQRTEIAGIYGVPPHLIGDVERSTSWGSGIEQQVIGFLTFTIRPWLARIEQRLLHDVFLPSHQGSLFPEFLVDGLLRGDALSRAQALRIQAQNGALSPNEWRAIENRNPREGGDQLMAPLNMAPLGRQQPAVLGKPATPSDPEEDDPAEGDER